MVLAGRGWLVSSNRAARDSQGAYIRLLLLSGIAAVAWLAGGFGVAQADTAPETGGLVGRVIGADDAVQDTVRTGAPREPVLAGAGDRASSLTDTVVPQTAALPAHALDGTGVTAALHETAARTATTRVVDDTARTVDGTARGAGELVTGVARAGRGVVETTDDSLHGTGLVDTVTEGLTDAGQGVGATVRRTVPVDLPALDAGTEPSVVPEVPGTAVPDAAREQEDAPGSAAGTAAAPPATVRNAASFEAAAEQAAAADDETADRVRLIAGGAPHSAGTDATGASAPSFPTPGAAGFLMARAVHTAPRAQRVALPGDPTLVVRDAADDPSYSPD